MNKYIVIGAIAIIIIGVVGFTFSRRQNNKDIAMIESVTSEQAGSTGASVVPTANVFPEITVEEEQKMFEDDQDRDGMSSAEEALLGTSDTAFDTDKDGLSDQLELNVLKTDPTNPDTDGDGFSDGVEVFEGFNPRGEGRLET